MQCSVPVSLNLGATVEWSVYAGAGEELAAVSAPASGRVVLYHLSLFADVWHSDCLQGLHGE
ncbi:protein of unknown function [Paenibacillus alvei]|uniref:Uncharacterized protein n=1 Tax=Paenibacillus alvei TaxID=44250 RepID=A0A383R5N5_PAEAL|nr:protein of unknown function [Paenibacillus alvei]